MPLNKIDKKMLDFNVASQEDIENKTGVLSQLTTKDKGNIVKAINETTAHLDEIAISIKKQGAKGNGTAIDSASIESSFTLASTTSIKTIRIPDGVYKIDRTIVIPRGIHLQLSQNAIIKPTTGNFNIFQFKPESRLSGGQIDLQGVTFTKSVFYFDAADVFQFYGQSHTLENINVLATNPGNGNFTGTGILMEAKTADGFIDNVKCNNLTFINIGKVIHLRVDPAVQTAYNSNNNKMAWVNANYFHQITAQNFKYGIYLEGTSSIPRDVAGNYFHGQFQSEDTTENVIYCESAYNVFDTFLWDVHKMSDSKPAIRFTKGSKFNKVKSALPLETTESWHDEGYMNRISSPGNYVPDAPSMAQKISMPYEPQMNGNQDDYMVFGHHRGYTVTQLQGVAATGNLNDMLIPDTEYGCTWDMSATDYDNPIVLEINTASDPISYLQYIGTMHSFSRIPEGLLIEAYDSSTNQWVRMHEIKGNKSSSINIAPPYSSVDLCTKIRISFYGSVATDKKVNISRIIGTSAKDGGKMFMRNYANELVMTDANGVPHTVTMGLDGRIDSSGSVNGVDGSYPPVQSGKPQMFGDQDDILANLPSWATFTVNLPKAAGEHVNMWDIRDENFASYNNPTVAAPLVIEMDFGTNPLTYIESLGIATQWGESAKNIKFEVVKTAGGSYSVAKNITGNTDEVVQIAYRSTAIYKLKITISEVNNTTTNRIKIGRIFATSGKSETQAFLPRHGGMMYGGLGIAKIGTLPTASVAYRGQMYRVEGGTGVADKMYVCMKSASDTYSWVQISTG